MTASKIFENLLKTIEESNLNYSIHKTPFSATVSLKCSFIKRFSDDSSTKSLECLKKSDVTEKLDFEKLKQEKEALKKELSELIESHGIETRRIKDLYKSEKEKVKKAEKQIADLREEVLNVKKDKHQMSAELKLAEASLSASEIQINQLNSTVSSAEKLQVASLVR